MHIFDFPSDSEDRLVSDGDNEIKYIVIAIPAVLKRYCQNRLL